MATPQASPLGANARLKFPLEVPWDASLHNVSGAGSAAAVTMAADALRPNVIAGIQCSYSAAPAAGAVQIEDGSGTVVWKQFLSGAGPWQFLFDPPRSFTPNTATIVTVASGGGAVVAALDVSGYKVA